MHRLARQLRGDVQLSPKQLLRCRLEEHDHPVWSTTSPGRFGWNKYMSSHAIEHTGVNKYQVSTILWLWKPTWGEVGRSEALNWSRTVNCRQWWHHALLRLYPSCLRQNWWRLPSDLTEMVWRRWRLRFLFFCPIYYNTILVLWYFLQYEYNHNLHNLHNSQFFSDFPGFWLLRLRLRMPWMPWERCLARPSADTAASTWTSCRRWRGRPRAKCSGHCCDKQRPWRSWWSPWDVVWMKKQQLTTVTAINIIDSIKL